MSSSLFIHDAAEKLRVSRSRIYKLIKEGQLKTIRTIAGSQRVLVESIEDYKRRNSTQDQSPSAA